MSMHPNYILPPTKEAHAQLALELTSNKNIVTDETGLNNQQKLDFIREAFHASETVSIFAEISYEEFYIDDVAKTCEAAAYMAELRVQYLAKLLAETPSDPRLHYLYLVNRQWHVRLRERARMQAYNTMTRKWGRLH